MIEPEADDYFIIFDIVGFLDGTQEIKMGLGSYIDNDKRSRIRWVPIEGNPQCYMEVIHGIPAYFPDLAIGHERI